MNNYSSSISTENDTPTIFWSIQSEKQDLTIIESYINGITDDFKEAAVFKISVSFLCSNDKLSIIGSQSIDAKKTFGFNNVSAKFIVADNDMISLQVIGHPDIKINWSAQVQIKL